MPTSCVGVDSRGHARPPHPALDGPAAIFAGEIYARLERTGDRIGVQDALIAGICRRFDLPLATRNVGHFKRVRGLRLIDVPAQ